MWVCELTIVWKFLDLMPSKCENRIEKTLSSVQSTLPFWPMIFEIFLLKWKKMKQNKKEEEEEVAEDNKWPTTNKTIMIIISTSQQFFCPLFHCTLHTDYNAQLSKAQCVESLRSIFWGIHRISCFFVCEFVLFSSYSGWWPLSQKFVSCMVWHDLFVGNYTVDKLKIGYNIQIVLCIEQSVSADFPLLLILIDLFFVYFWANRRWVFWTVVQCQDQNQNREHKQTNRHYHLYHHISHYASRLLIAAIGHHKSMILFQLQKKN